MFKRLSVLIVSICLFTSSVYAASLPVPDGDSGVWGTKLNEYLTVSHESDGNLKPRVEPSTAWLKTIATNAMTSGCSLVGDGTTNDTTAIGCAITAAIASTTNLWDGHHVLYFPANSYVWGGVIKSGAACSNLYIIGDQNATIFKRSSASGNGPLSEFTDCTHTRISHVAMDANGCTAFCGFKFYSSTDVIVEHNHFYDSVNKGGVLYGNASDLYGLLFARGTTTSKDIIIRNNLFEDLQTEIAHCQRCLIDQNTSLRSPTSVGMGSFAVNATGSILEDITYSRNRIVDPHARGIYVGNDSTGWNSAVFRRIKIIDNEIEYITRIPTSSAIRLGSSSTVTVLTGNVFDDVWVLRNKIKFMRQGATTPNDIAVIYISIGTNNAYVMNRLEISKNQIEANTRVDGYLIDVDYIRGSLIEGNYLNGVRVGAIRVQNTGTTTIKGNICKVFAYGGICYFHDGTTVGTPNPSNTVWDDNYFVGINGGSDSPLSNAGNGVGDSVEAPTSATSHGDVLPDSVVWNPPSLSAGAAPQTTNLTMAPGAVSVGWACVASFTLDLQGTQLWCEVTSTTNVRIFHQNRTAGTVDLGSGTVNIQLFVR